MFAFRDMLDVDSPTNLLPKVLVAAAKIEGVERVMGAVGDRRRAKSLLQRWMATMNENGKGKGNPAEPAGVRIERNTIVTVKVKIGRRAAGRRVMRYFRVVNVFDKYYNKWFMAKEPSKVWKKEEKPYKLELRMLDKSPLNEFVDVELIESDTSRVEDVCKIIVDSEVVSVVGKMKQAM